VAGAAAEPAATVQRLDELTRRLRRECPWDREQDERSIVPHTVEEAYELADAAHAGDDAKLLDELGDVLFQVMFLSLLLEERGRGDLAAVAEHCRQKLIRRHPHVFGDVEAERAADVVRNWDAIKRDEAGTGSGVFGDIPQLLPATLYARKALRRAGAAGREGRYAEEPMAELRRATEALEKAGDRDARFEAVGDVLLAAVAAARKLETDPELALRAAAARFIEEVEPKVE
jgi:MazG family protein